MQSILARIKDNGVKKKIETCRLYCDENKDDCKVDRCRLYIEREGVVHSLEEIKIAAIKKGGVGIYYWNNGDLVFKELRGWNIMFEEISAAREEMENLLKRLENGDIKIKRKVKRDYKDSSESKKVEEALYMCKK